MKIKNFKLETKMPPKNINEIIFDAMTYIDENKKHLTNYLDNLDVIATGQKIPSGFYDVDVVFKYRNQNQNLDAIKTIFDYIKEKTN